MIRKAFIMELHEGHEKEYEARHRPIWKELEAKLKEHGVSNYSIYLDKPKNLLFGYAEVEDEARWKSIADTAICKKWWAYMKDIMATNPDNSPKSVELKEVFHMD